MVSIFMKSQSRNKRVMAENADSDQRSDQITRWSSILVWAWASRVRKERTSSQSALTLIVFGRGLRINCALLHSKSTQRNSVYAHRVAPRCRGRGEVAVLMFGWEKVISAPGQWRYYQVAGANPVLVRAAAILRVGIPMFPVGVHWLAGSPVCRAIRSCQETALSR